MEKNKIWKGRINKEPDSFAEKFTSSINIDKNLYMQDLTGTAAYVIGLESIGIINTQELKQILSGLKKIRDKIRDNFSHGFKPDDSGIYSGIAGFDKYEDIHSLIEYELGSIVGKPATKIHTGRSRNDQIVVDELLFLKESILETIEKLIVLEELIAEKSASNLGLIFAAYTHTQRAQPVLVSHYLLSYFEKFIRNTVKLFQAFEGCDFLPLGAAACTGSGYGLDTKLLAELLKFSRTGSNSMDIVSSRDFIMDYIYCCSMIMLNLSRFCEDLIIYNTQEFSFIDIDESFCTGSSIMPQKKNPDILELIRGKSAVVNGNLMQIMGLFKGLPSTYNSDMQEDKKILFAAKKDTIDSIGIFTRVLKNIEFNKDNISSCLNSGFIEATDVADYLVKKGESFRKAHHITGKMVRYCIEEKIQIKDIPIEKLKSYSLFFDADFKGAIEKISCINSKNTSCGTSEKAVKDNISKSKKIIESYKKALEALRFKIPDFDTLINGYI